MWPFSRRDTPTPQETRSNGNAGGSMSIDQLLRAMSGPGGGPNPERVQRTAYRDIQDVYAAVQYVQNAAKTVPWVVRQAKSRTARNQTTRPQHRRRSLTWNKRTHADVEDAPNNHPVHDLLEQPNPWHAWEYVVDHFVGGLLLKGDAYAFLVAPSPTAPPREIIPIPWTHVRETRNPATMEVAQYHVRTGNTETPVPPEFMVHAFTWNPADVFHGQGSLRPATGSAALSSEMRRWNWNLVKNSARPPGNFVTPDTLTEQAYARMRKQIVSEYQGAENAGLPGLLEGGLKFENNGFPPAQMEWVEGIQENKRGTAVTFGVPPQLMGDTASSTYNNMLHARLAIYEDRAIPLLQVIQHAFQVKLRAWWGDLVLQLDVDSVPAMQERRREFIASLTQAIGNGLLTPNEAREMIGYDEITGADVLLGPMNLMPLTDNDDDDPGEEDAFPDEEEEPEEEEEEPAARVRVNAGGNGNGRRGRG